jgi:hypothetical protein
MGAFIVPLNPGCSRVTNWRWGVPVYWLTLTKGKPRDDAPPRIHYSGFRRVTDEISRRTGNCAPPPAASYRFGEFGEIR